MKCSIVVCTHNRSEQLEVVLEPLILQNYSHADYEIVVVDNHSTDKTKDVVRDVIKRSPVSVRYVHEKEIGLSHARNRGIRESSGEIIAFIDDDAIADYRWIESLLSSYKEKDIVCVGGKALLKWPERFIRPNWLNRRLEPFLSGFDLGLEKETEVRGISKIPYGVNISFRREVLLKNPFSIRLGRTDKRLYGGEETELCLRLIQQGWKIVYNPKAVVHHIVPEARTEQSYFIQRALDWGISRVVVDNFGIIGKWKIRHLISYLIRFLVYSVKYLMYTTVRWEGHAFNAYIRMRSYWVSINYCVGNLRQKMSQQVE